MFQNKHVDWQNFSSGELKSSQGYLPNNNGFYNFSKEDTVREIPTSILRDMPEYNKQIDLYAARYINENPKISINTSRVTVPDLKTYSSHGDLVQNANASSVNEDKHLYFD